MIRKREKLCMSIPPKQVAITARIEIHNMNNSKPYRAYDVKCDRTSPLGSPFYLCGDESRRSWVCDSYQQWFEDEVLTYKNWKAYEELMRLRELYRKHGRLRVFCWCSPSRCHTQTIVNWLERNK